MIKNLVETFRVKTGRQLTPEQMDASWLPSGNILRQESTCEYDPEKLRDFRRHDEPIVSTNYALTRTVNSTYDQQGKLVSKETKRY